MYVVLSSQRLKRKTPWRPSSWVSSAGMLNNVAEPATSNDKAAPLEAEELAARPGLLDIPPPAGRADPVRLQAEHPRPLTALATQAA
jgi:hypothetical protein